MENLRIMYNTFDDDGLVYVQGIKKLRALDIRCCQRIDDDGLAHLEDMHESRSVLKIFNSASPTPD